eukprot:CAMPEP_0184706122 /NCGR_PEP_ID=MMETSP0313-20130426/36595_1 /TAXON_ID=2792 /ORGANISM="Porphyridium aerugineum, Strain SAG 1380-2" /LENGTH=423 /DNA_ID=CAMNT_0027167665 /DNA_START=56 /DNA_END=1327 /DNA_ORIENTATION=-
MVTGTPATMTNILGTTSEDVINIGKGHPHRSLLELESIKQAFILATHQQDADINMMQYGPGRGNASILKSIRENFHPNAVDNSIMVTTGSSHGLDLVACLFTKPGDVIYVDSPAYFLAFFTFRDHHLVVEDIPTGTHGMDVEILEKKLEHAKANNMKMPSMLYTVPIANNPCGTSMTTVGMQRLVELSRKYKFKIASDEVYRFLTFPASNLVAPPSLMEFDDPTNPTVFSLNSFSKLLGPGIRLGWIHSHPSHIQKIVDGGLVLSGGGCNPFTSEIVNQLLVTGEQQRIIANLRRVYEGNLKVMVDSIEEFLVPIINKYKKDYNIVESGKSVPLYSLPEGGYFLWIQLPDGLVDTWELNTMATEKFKVNFFPGAKFCSTGRGSRLDNGIRICFAFLTQEMIKEGVCRLSNAIQAAIDAKSSKM